MDLATFIEEHMYFTVLLASALQVIGTLILGLFSFYGLKISESPNAFVNGKAVTRVSVDAKWLNGARIALFLLLLGILLAAVASLAGMSVSAAG